MAMADWMIHGGMLDAASEIYGIARDRWLDLSTGINANPYPLPDLAREYWYRLPDAGLDAWLRESAGQSVPAGSFIEHHVGGLVYPQGLTRDAQQLLGFSLLGFNLAVYAVAAWRRARRRRIA